MKGKSKLLKRISAWYLCLAVVIATINMPVFTMKAEAATTLTIDGIKYELYDDGTAKVVENYPYGYAGNITIPSTVNYNGNNYTVTEISDMAFFNCDSLYTISLPDSITNIGSSAFRMCSSLTSINIPPRVTSIGETTFSSCFSLTSVTIPSGVTSIGSSAFYRCSSLNTINLPESITNIGSGAFYWSGLTSINIPSKVTSIESITFSYCGSLTSVTIPSGVTSIGSDAFSECPVLTDIEFKCATPPSFGEGSIPASVVNIKVPNGSAATYGAIFTTATIEEAPPTSTPQNSASKSSNSPAHSHSHSLSWVVTKEPTYNSDGTSSLICSSCGYVESTQTISRAGVVYTDVANKFEASLRNLQPGKKALLELGDWHSVPSYLMERVIKSNVDVEITYKYKGKNYDIIIPAGKGIDLHIPWYGPLLMNALYNK